MKLFWLIKRLATLYMLSDSSSDRRPKLHPTKTEQPHHIIIISQLIKMIFYDNLDESKPVRHVLCCLVGLRKQNIPNQHHQHKPKQHDNTTTQHHLPPPRVDDQRIFRQISQPNFCCLVSSSNIIFYTSFKSPLYWFLPKYVLICKFACVCWWYVMRRTVVNRLWVFDKIVQSFDVRIMCGHDSRNFKWLFCI